MKRVLSALLAIIITLSAVVLPVSGYDETRPMTIAISSATGLLGKTVDVTVSVENNPGVTYMALEILFDEANLSLEEIRYNENLGGTTIPPESTPIPSPVTLQWANGFENWTEDGVFATLTFKVSETAALNVTTEIRADYDQDNICNTNEENIPVTIQYGKISIIPLAGDINGDGKVNGKDITRLMQHIAKWKVSVNSYALDVNGDKKINGKDVTRLMQYIAKWPVQIFYDTTHTHTYSDFVYADENDHKRTCKCGDVQLEAHSWDAGVANDSEITYTCTICGGTKAEAVHKHTLTATAEKAATCTEDGNIAYWHCTECGKYFSDADGKNEITLADTVRPATRHTVVIDAAVPATTTSTGLTEGSHCSVCHTVLVEQQETPKLKPNTANITYNLAYSDKYLAEQTIINPNPNSYEIGKGLTLSYALYSPGYESVPGYKFIGWSESTADDGEIIREIPASATRDFTLYAKWEKQRFNVTYKLYQTPIENTITNATYLTYTVDKGMQNLPNPDIYNYIFLGWYTDDGKEVTKIPIGSTGDIVLNAYWTSKRNLAKVTNKPQEPIIIEDVDDGVIYFTYELGTIENIPLSNNIWTIQSVANLAQQQSETYTTSLSQTKADAISSTISNSTVDSGTWTLSQGWNDSTSVTQEWADQHNKTLTEANEDCKTESNTYSITDSEGGSSSNTRTDGTTTVGYGSQNTTTGLSAELAAKIEAKYSNEKSITSKVTGTFEVGGEISAGVQSKKEENAHTGTDTTEIDTTVESSSATWNSAKTSSQTTAASRKSSVSQAISDIISSKTGYGSTYTKNGQNSETQGFSKTDSNSVNSSSTLTWSSVDSKTVTKTYSTDGHSEGCYRLVIAGKAHVFGIVGYHIATQSYFTYTYSIMDDEQYEFLDYAPDLNFNDCENSVLPFEIPADIHTYVTDKIATTVGVRFRTNTATGTATVTGYNGTDTDVKIPTYLTSGGKTYKVTGISASAFAGKSIRSISIGDYVKQIPAGAFKNCTALKQIEGSFTEIGDEAFSGCTALENFNVNIGVTAIGKNAFAGVPSLRVYAIGEEYALAAVDNDRADAIALTQDLIDSAICAGADKLCLDLSFIMDGCALSLNVPQMQQFELLGGSKTYPGMCLHSDAAETILRSLKITDSTRIPLEINSTALTLDTISVESPSFCLLLSGEPTVSLIRDNTLISAGNRAMVCKNTTLVSVIEKDKIGTSVDGFLSVSGDIYVCGNINGKDCIEFISGTIRTITESEFANYIKGLYTLYFDANGGVCSTTSQEAVNGVALGTLPTPTRQYYTFDGWFTEPTAGERVTESSSFARTEDLKLYAHWTRNSFLLTLDANGGRVNTSTIRGYCGTALGELPTPTRDYYTFTGWYTQDNDSVTDKTVYKEAKDLTLYAHWELNPLSDWVEASAMPTGARVENSKWAYTLRHYDTGSEPTKSGWNTSGKERTSWSAWSSWSRTDPTNGERNVEKRTGTEYHYYRWIKGNSVYSTYRDGHVLQEKWFDHRLPVYDGGSLGSAVCIDGSGLENRWIESTCDSNYSVDRTFTRSYSEWRYQEPVYTYTYYIDTRETATTDPTGQDNVSDVVRYVQYREK